MIWIIIVVLIGLFIWQTLLLKRHKTSIEGFEMLLTRFIEVNQEFYEGQKIVLKKDKEMIDGLIKQISEISILSRYSKQIESANRNTNEVIKNLKETQQEIKSVTEEMNVSKDIATSLVNVSSNIKLLDKFAIQLKDSIDKLKRR